MASLEAAVKAAVEVAEEAVVAVAAGVEAREEPSRPVLLPSSELGSVCRTKQCAQRHLQSLIKPSLKPRGQVQV